MGWLSHQVVLGVAVIAAAVVLFHLLFSRPRVTEMKDNVDAATSKTNPDLTLDAVTRSPQRSSSSLGTLSTPPDSPATSAAKEDFLSGIESPARDKKNE